MLVLAIGTGGKEEVAEQFKNLNAGAIDISCDSSDSGGFSFEMPGGGGSVTVTNMGGGPGGGSGGGTSGGPGGGMDFGGFFGFGQEEESEAVTLTSEDCDDLATFVSGIYNCDCISLHIGGGRQYEPLLPLHVGVKTWQLSAISNLHPHRRKQREQGKGVGCWCRVAKEIFGSTSIL